MRSRLYGIAILLLALSYSIGTCAQVPDEDSLEQAILQSVQHQLNQHKLPGPFFDSSKIFSGSPVDLNKFFQDLNKKISAAKSAGDIGSVGKAYHNLSTIDSIRGNYRGAYENYKLYTIYRDSLQKKELEKKELQAKMQREFDRKQAQQKLEKEKEDRKNAIRQILLIAILIAFITISTTSFIAYKREQKAKKLLHIQKKEIEDTLSELKSTQAQLIQSEKMASLGELTAGIAHEIQNPLNFVNNFSEVNKELVGELETEILNENKEEAIAIANDIKANEEKINHHGKRADAIVKGMLQHSRRNAGQKESTDINALCDEYLRLSYHGMRAKDKNFNSEIKTDFDESIGKINVVPQDIGIVLLNLYNNAFYAASAKASADSNFTPLVSVQTKKLTDKIEIKVSDNGNGIPQNIVDKIFQPFFTTKPTGQGTGLGLSLSYDIIKAHEGEIKVETKEGGGSEFIIILNS